MGEEPSAKQFYVTQIRHAFFFGGLHCLLEEVGEKDPEDASREHEKFQKQLSHVLKGSLGLARNKKELKQCIQKAGEQQGDSIELGKLAAAEFSDAAGRLEMFKQSRTHGIRGANATLQDSLFAVARFAAAYSNVLEAVSKTAGPYTEIGYQTMTILLIVFVNKKRHDDKVKGHLDQIQKILPRLEAWKGIYPDEEMEKLVSKTYHLVIQFSRSAVEYFCRRWKRVRMAVNPFSMSSNFDEVAQRIYATLAEVNAEANQRLHASSQIIERTVLELRESNAALKMQLDDRDKQDDEEKFETLEEELSPDGTMSNHPCFDHRRAKSILKKAFPNANECSSAIPWSMYTLMTPARILSHRFFRTWADTQGSALLFIHGRTSREGRASTVTMPCWLSPAAIHIFEHISRLEQLELVGSRIIYFSCRPELGTSIDQATEVLTMVALKLLSTRKDILRARLKDFQKFLPSISPVSSRASSPTWSRPSFSSSPSRSSFSPRLAFRTQSAPVIPALNDQGDMIVFQDAPSMSKSALDQARLFLSEVLTEISKREARRTAEKDEKRTTAYIILDRLDCIGDEVQLKKFLRELAYLTTEKDAFCVKVVAVAEARLQEHNWKDSLPQDLVYPDQVFEVKMDQRELSSKEMAKEKRQLLWEN